MPFLAYFQFITLCACPPTRIYAPCFLDSRLVTPTLPGHRAKGPNKGPKGPKGAFGALGGVGPWGPWGVIPKPFRMESPFKWRFTVPRVTMKVNRSDMKAVANGSWNDAQIKVLKRASALEHARACKRGRGLQKAPRSRFAAIRGS